MPAPDSILQLVERFSAQRSAYKSGKYNETQLRRDFLDPFFEALGWDMSNRGDKPERLREVVYESSVDAESQVRADYAFRLGSEIVFFVEAKKPSVNIEYNPQPAFQLRSYGWSKKLPISVLTDFEEFAVYDCTLQPNPGDPSNLARKLFYTYTDYIAKWDEIEALFSHRAVMDGSIDRFAGEMLTRRQTQDVDDAFLAEMERWRRQLARNIALRNPTLSVRELNIAVQSTIDRLIFLRICEDRGIEPQNSIRDATDGEDVYADLVQLFIRADKRYNSGLFHFTRDKNTSSQPDTLALTLKIDDAVLKDILAHLYPPLSPYAFYYIPVEILGQVYERFLGKVIHLSADHQAEVEDKPEVRKAGGVYYTPTYIVEYIVKNTVGELLKDQTPETLKNRPLRVLDPACGSGSFLLGAYQYLLDWYLDWYLAHEPLRWSKGKNAVLFEGRDGWQLTMEKKKEILLSHIFGVDIDAQAVEVTKLSLLLKVVEHPGQLSLLEERILPDLGRNIQCGNSLIGDDYFAGQQPGMFDLEEQYRVNPFDWQRAFPQVFPSPLQGGGREGGAGGFDAVIGNPPYIRIQTMKEWAPYEVELYKDLYKSASVGNYDIYVVFIEKALSLASPTGKIGLILPHKFFQAQFAKPIREILSEKNALEEIVHFGSLQIFENATTYTCLLFLSNRQIEKFRYVSVKSLSNPETVFNFIADGLPHTDYSEKLLPQPINGSDEWNFSADGQDIILSKLRKQPFTLGDITRKIFVGLQTSADKIYVLRVIKDNGTTITCYSQSLEKEVEIERGLVKPFLMGKDVHRYEPIRATNVVIFPYFIQNGKAILMTRDFISENYPKGWLYLQNNKLQLEKRENGKMKGENFYAYIYPKNLAEFDTVKLMTPEIALGCQLSIDNEGVLYHTTKVYSFIFRENHKENRLYFLGVLNSKLLWFFLKSTGYTLRGGYFTFKTEYLKPFPIRVINFDDPKDVQRHDQMVSLVERMLELHKQLAAARLPQEKELLERQIHATDEQIDRLVYELYGLTEEEIRLVEGG